MSRHRTATGSPALSVVMPVHNAAPYLADSIGSILGQTFGDFELVILDDASTDGSRDIIRTWQARDRRVRLVESPIQLGPAGSADRVVREARAPICARMDADDVSQPTRLDAQMAVLRDDAAVSLVGTLWTGIDARGRTVRPRDRWRVARASVFAPFPHGSIMFRREWFLRVGGYRTPCAYWEDLDFYLRMAEVGPIMVLTDALYRYRFHALATTASRTGRQLDAVNLMYRCVDRAAAGEDYGALLGPDAHEARNDPRALRSWGSPRLWAGERTAMLAELRDLHGAITDPDYLYAALIAVWGEVSPRSLRLVLRGLIHLRDAAASLRVPDRGAVRWTPGTRTPRVVSRCDSRRGARTGSILDARTAGIRPAQEAATATNAVANAATQGSPTRTS